VLRASAYARNCIRCSSDRRGIPLEVSRQLVWVDKWVNCLIESLDCVRRVIPAGRAKAPSPSADGCSEETNRWRNMWECAWLPKPKCTWTPHSTLPICSPRVEVTACPLKGQDKPGGLSVYQEATRGGVIQPPKDYVGKGGRAQCRRPKRRALCGQKDLVPVKVPSSPFQ